MAEGFTTFQNFMHAGGPLMWPLLLLSLGLWYLLGQRLYLLRSKTIDNAVEKITTLVNEQPTQKRRNFAQALSWQESQTFHNYRHVIGTLISAAPLLGLLGTVGGIVHCFDALSGTLVLNQTSVAGGISEALLSTQFGLLIAVPALATNLLLNRKEEFLRRTFAEKIQEARALGGSHEA